MVMPKYMKRRIGLYLRVSTDNQLSDEGSLKSQKQRLLAEAKHRQGNDPSFGEVVEIYIEEARSAKDTNRPEFQRMLRDIKSGKINIIMVTELSRLSRSVVDFLNIIAFLSKYKADFICLQYNFDTTTPSGKVFLTIIVALAQFEREMTSERVKNNFLARAERGLFNGGHIPLGYNSNSEQKGYLVVHEHEAAIVKDIFDLTLKCGSIRQAVVSCKEKGYKTKKLISENGNILGGVNFTRSILTSILTNRTYLGEKEINKDNKHVDPAELPDKEKYRIVPAVWKAIIDKEVFDRVQKMIDHNRSKQRNHPTKDYQYILSGLIKCGCCNAIYTGASAKGKYFYYEHKGKCPDKGIKRIDTPDMEDFILRRLKKITKDKELLVMLVEESQKQHLTHIQDNDNLLKSLQNEKTVLRQQADSLIDKLTLLPKEAVKSSFIGDKLAEFEDRKSKLDDQIIHVQKMGHRARDSQVQLKEMQKALELLLSKFKGLPATLKREILRQIIHSIEINDVEIKIALYGKSDTGLSIENDDGNLLTTCSYDGRIGSPELCHYW